MKKLGGKLFKKKGTQPKENMSTQGNASEHVENDNQEQHKSIFCDTIIHMETQAAQIKIENLNSRDHGGRIEERKDENTKKNSNEEKFKFVDVLAETSAKKDPAQFQASPQEQTNFEKPKVIMESFFYPSS